MGNLAHQENKINGNPFSGFTKHGKLDEEKSVSTNYFLIFVSFMSMIENPRGKPFSVYKPVW